MTKDYETRTATIDGKPVEYRVPKDYGKPKRRKVAPFNPSPAAILRAAIKAALGKTST